MVKAHFCNLGNPTSILLGFSVALKLLPFNHADKGTSSLFLSANATFPQYSHRTSSQRRH